MTKQDFLDKLKQQINHLPQKDYQEIIDHFTEYFDEAGPDHEQAILKELGNPEDIAKELLKALDLPKKQTKMTGRIGKLTTKQSQKQAHKSLSQ